MGGVNGAEALRALHALQEKDLEIDRLQKEAETLPEDLLALKARVEALEAELMALLERQAELRKAYARHSLDIEDLAAKEKQAEAEQRQAQSAREQTQYENRIQQIKDRIRELLELSTPIMEAMEEVEAAIARVEEVLTGLKPRLEELLRENAERVEALKGEILKLQGEREAMAQGIPAPVLKEYEAIRRAKRGTGVVRMLPKGQVFRCEGCNVVLPTHVAQKVIQAHLTRCPSCGRLLWKGEA
ncbi:zinc ribbon domain-containing protein [Thermus sediminis]|uniref:zinc ribbon domain-containing protein n=1 Tax=Thermus sediminis TaxID=1761908 RepID=UPI000E3E4505|nr:C4-type zinc ribbon domain-containing protein [Thermus sediminis]